MIPNVSAHYLLIVFQQLFYSADQSLSASVFPKCPLPADLFLPAQNQKRIKPAIEICIHKHQESKIPLKFFVLFN